MIMKKGKVVMTMSAVFVSLLVMATSCDKSSDNTVTDNRPYTISGNASGNQVIPPVAGASSATITGTYNPANNELNYTSNWTGLSGMPSIAGLYIGAAGAGGVAVGTPWTLSSDGGTGTITDKVTLTNDQAMQLLKGNMYYTYGTALNPSGEVRGQISVTR